MDVRKIVLDVLRQGFRTLGRFLSTVPAGWLILMGILALPVAIMSVLVALFALLTLLFYQLVWRPVFSARRRQEKVIEVEYTVKSDDD